MRGWVRLVGFVIALAGAVVALRDAGSKERGKAAGTPARAACDLPAATITYTHVEPIFAAKCASCHDARKSDVPPKRQRGGTPPQAPQRVFEMSRYPFATARPTTLVADLKQMFEVRGSLTAQEKCLGIAWIAGGARDAEGNLPRWRE